MSKQTVGSIMERDAYRCRDTATLDEVTAQLIERGVSSLPVVDERNRVVGFISDGDIMRAIAEHKTRSIFSEGAPPFSTTTTSPSRTRFAPSKRAT